MVPLAGASPVHAGMSLSPALRGEIHEHITVQIPLSVKIDELCHLKSAVREVDEGRLTDVVAGLALAG